MKYLGIKINVHDLYTEIYQTLLREIKEDPKK